jgi:hypothetical protein
VTSAIFELKPDYAYVGLTYVDERNFDFPADTEMKAIQRKGPVFDVMFNSRRVKPETVKVPDCVHFLPEYLCVSVGAWAIFKDDLALQGLSVRLKLTEGGRGLEFVLFEPELRIDALDFERSEVQRFDTPPYRVKWVDKLILNENATAVEQDIFHINHMPTRLFCTEKCVRLVKKHKLTGFVFHQVSSNS